MMLTGKAIYEASRIDTSLTKEWDELFSWTQKEYDNLAKKLNEQLQSQIAGLEQQVEKLKSDIKALRDLDRAIFDDQDRKIATLKALVLDWQQYVKDDDDMPLDEHFKAEHEAAQEQRAKLEQRTRELCREEQ